MTCGAVWIQFGARETWKTNRSYLGPFRASEPGHTDFTQTEGKYGRGALSRSLPSTQRARTFRFLPPQRASAYAPCLQQRASTSSQTASTGPPPDSKHKAHWDCVGENLQKEARVANFFVTTFITFSCDMYYFLLTFIFLV